MMDLGAGMVLGFSLIIASLVVYIPPATILGVLVSQRILRLIQDRKQWKQLLIQMIFLSAGFVIFLFTIGPALVWYLAKWIMHA